MIGIGDKVVLVDDSWPESTRHLWHQFPVKGPVYVVRDAFPGIDSDVLFMDCHRKVATCLLLIGIVNPAGTRPGAKERGFNADRFRKLESRSELASNARHEVT